MKVQIKRVYDEPAVQDGLRILVDRLWPRGLAKARAQLDFWLPDLAPSPDLRKWYGHQVPRWPEFRRRYFEELDKAGDAIQELAGHAGNAKVTLLFAAKDVEHSHARALQEYLNHIR